VPTNPPQERDKNKFATTNVTNEHARAIASLIEANTGQVDDGFVEATAVFPAKITGHTGTAHAWTEVDAKGAAVSGARTGTATDNPAFDLFGRVLVNDSLVTLVQSTYDDGGTRKQAMEIVETLPAPTAQYQIIQCTSFTSVTVNTKAFDFVRAHA
jgi:hypothetical protein